MAREHTVTDIDADAVDQGPGGPDSEELRRALKAFKKRMKIMRREEESSLGRGPLSGGKRATIVAIVPPSQFPREVWDKLVQQGKLRYSGHGLYELPPAPGQHR